MRVILIGLIRGYQIFISPLLPPACRFYPTCSQYAITAIDRFGPLKGTGLAAWRICRCNPFCPGGFDPVPPRSEDRRSPYNASRQSKGESAMKPYQTVTIAESHDPLVPIMADRVTLIDPHPYVAVGAPYGEKSPFYLRQSVLDKLITAQTRLQATHPGWRIQVFDAYRPLAVQAYMVEWAFQELLRDRALTEANLTPAEREELMTLVYQFWAAPNPNPATPPPHSTGAAIDVTLVDETGQVVDMGSPIDEISPRSYPHHFSDSADPQEQLFHANRQLLVTVMTAAGFEQHMNEWWHFSWGDQLWAWLRKERHGEEPIAQYGRVE